jgi:hypothetical protein
MQDISTNLSAVAKDSSKKAPEAIPIFLPQLIEALASLNIQVTSPFNQLKGIFYHVQFFFTSTSYTIAS